MKKPLLKSLSVLSCTLMLGIGGCTTDFTDDPQVPNLADETIGPKTRSLESAIFNEGAQVWMVPQKDPYTLANFQQAYENLLSGNTAQPLTRSEIASIADAEPLKATHYRLKIYPKTEAEEWEIERMEDVKVAYIPFDYVQLTKDESEKIAASTRTQAAVFPEKSPYSVTYDDAETCDGPADPVTFTLPVLYAVWPCDKPLPEDMEYEIECKVFIPSYGVEQTRSAAPALSEGILQRLESEAISLALGTPVRQETRATVVAERVLYGNIYHWDNLISKKVAQPTMKQRFQLGSSIWETYTHREDGYFAIRAAIPNEASYSHVFQSPRWKITPESSTSPIVTSYGTVAENWPYSASVVNMCPANPTVEYSINRAVDYFYYGEHQIPKWNYDDGIRIIAATNPSTEYDAVFTYSSNKRAFITVPNNHRNLINETIGAVLHELGHFVHYNERGGYSGYKGVHGFIKESFASYVGWYLSEEHYRELGYYHPSEGDTYNYLNDEDRQFWRSTIALHYSPLFVDLSDRYNQNTYLYVYNQDNIENVPHPIIVKLAVENKDWSSLKNALIGYIGVYYNRDQYEEFIAPYDYWFAHN